MKKKYLIWLSTLGLVSTLALKHEIISRQDPKEEQTQTEPKKPETIEEKITGHYEIKTEILGGTLKENCDYIKKTYGADLEEALNSGIEVSLFFTGDHCTPCKNFKRDILEDYIEKCEKRSLILEIYDNKETALFQRFGRGSIPIFTIIKKDKKTGELEIIDKKRGYNTNNREETKKRFNL